LNIYIFTISIKGPPVGNHLSIKVCIHVCVCDSGVEGFQYLWWVHDVSNVDGQSLLSLATALGHSSPLETQTLFEL
jgi:hypothetical protein